MKATYQRQHYAYEQVISYVNIKALPPGYEPPVVRGAYDQFGVQRGAGSVAAAGAGGA